MAASKEYRQALGLGKREAADNREIQKQTTKAYIGYVNTLPHKKGWVRKCT